MTFVRAIVGRAAGTTRHSVSWVVRRTGIHQSQQQGQDDMTWLEAGDREMTAEERYAFDKQQRLLNRQADALLAKYASEHSRTREQLEAQHSQKMDKIDALETQLNQLQDAMSCLTASLTKEEGKNDKHKPQDQDV